MEGEQSCFADWVSGGKWSYGSYHDPSNWGAFSNYFHDYRWYWASDSKSNVGYASAHYTSRSFININFGEFVYFNYGF